jgi:hypothetical protein
LLTKDLLIDFLASKNLSQRDKVLLILLAQDGVSISIRNIQAVALAHGVRQITAWNIPRILANARGYAVKMPEGWTLTPSGRTYVQDKYVPNDPGSTKEIALGLRSHLDKISNPDTRDFVEEAIRCLEADLKRSAVVMSWAGAMSILYDYVIADADRLRDFNARATLRFPKWKPAITKDDLMLMPEGEFLDILAHLSILSKNTKERLKSYCLDLRNACGHPSSMKIERYTVEAHIAFLILNVYEKF